MKKQVLALSTSPRRGGNSELLADAFLHGAAAAGHETEKICLYDKNIQFCRGCLACQKTQRCVIHDDVEGILEKMRRADVVVFATPIYFYEMSGQMKTLLDRSNPLFPAEYAFRDVYLLASAADGDESAMNGAVKGLEGWISCFDQARLTGVMRGVGVDSPGAIRACPAILEQAAQMGRNV
ncbi:flavodoxin family protein [Intestinibacillus massiliensis]|uniref:flavodoxin family protein n=1 Tax=Intestinibacillus massiliensis TaxID=1871029 RepID=UPI000B36498F|nr:flavodoxin family protein [Intestinibacillus massiliensis]